MSESEFTFLNGNKMVEFHMLKLYPASALNRDDAGEQKTAYYNGTLRNRISSQCLKRAYRRSDSFTEAFRKIGVRTKRMPEIVGERLVKAGIPQKEADMIKLIMAGVDLTQKYEKESSKPKALQDYEKGDPVQSKAIAFYTPEELDIITEICKKLYDEIEEPKEKNLKTKTVKQNFENGFTTLTKDIRPLTLDVAAFGRMVTDNMLRPVEGAMQVAHALSTNSAIKESDYFIACDDLLNGEDDSEEKNNKGSAMMGDIDYDSACYYVHAVADLEQFTENLSGNEDKESLVKALPAGFADVMAYTDPSARQNSFEAHVLPEVLYVELKDKKRPLNRMKAFAKPCDHNVLEASVKALAANIETVSQKADLGVTHSVWYCEDESFGAPSGVTIAHSIPELEKILNEWMNS